MITGNTKKVKNTSTSGFEMADVLNETDQVLNDTLQNATTKTPATPEGMAVAYSSLLFMALVPIVVGSFRSVRFQREQKVDDISSVFKDI